MNIVINNLQKADCFATIFQHIKLLTEARALGDVLIVGINSDAWLERKKGRAFMPITERREIIKNLKSVDATIPVEDTDDSACELLELINYI